MKTAAIILTVIAILIGLSGLATFLSGILPSPTREVMSSAMALAGIGQLVFAGLVLMLAGIAILLDIVGWTRAYPAPSRSRDSASSEAVPLLKPDTSQRSSERSDA